MKVVVKDAETPWLDANAEKRYKSELNQEGKYGFMAASPLMAGLYGARSTRPDLIIPTLRQTRRLSRWTAFDDRKLLRYLGYMRLYADSRLSGTLSTSDCTTAVLRIWPDADLAGDPSEDAKSTSGSWIEVASLCGDRFMGVHWSASKQGGVADSTPMAELDSMHSAQVLRTMAFQSQICWSFC